MISNLKPFHSVSLKNSKKKMILWTTILFLSIRYWFGQGCTGFAQYSVLQVMKV